MDAYTAPETENLAQAQPLSMFAMVLTVLCGVLGVLGLLNACMTTLSTAWSYAAPAFMDPAQAAAMESVRASQGWWVPLLTMSQVLAKFILSVGLVVGGAAAFAKQAWGRRVFTGVLVYGILFELLVGLFGAGYTVWNRNQMGQDFGDIMASDPNFDPAVADTAGDMFGTIIAATVLLMLLWAVGKSVLYGATMVAIRR